jgi:hypothetical protein
MNLKVKAMKIRIKNILLIIIVMLTGCTKKYLDINTDPTASNNAPLKNMLTSAEVDLAYKNCMNPVSGGLADIVSVFVHQTTTREAWDQYGVVGTAFSIDQTWEDLYTKPLMTLEYIINKGLTDGNLRYAGIAQILKAYQYSVMVDVWGDVPFSQASKIETYPHPVFDKGENIYPQLISLLNKGIINLKIKDPTKNVLTPSSDDLIYGGSVNKWIRLANSLKLDLLNHQRKYKDVTADVKYLVSIATDSLMADGGDFQLWFNKSNNPDNRHPAFVNEYAGAQMEYTISPYFHIILKGSDPDIFTGITDPRIPYYFFNQLSVTNPTPQNPSEYLDGYFLSIWFGSTGANRDYDQRISQTTLGIYPIGGKYDDGTGGGVKATDGAGGAAPFRFLTYADVLFIRAELANVGLTTEDPKDLLKQGMEAAFNHIDYVVKNSGTTQTVPKLDTSTIASNYRDSILSYYDKNPAKQLRTIMTQKWIAGFGGSTVEMYSDYRRTGFPVMFDPNNDGNNFTTCSRKYPRSLPWSNYELTLNPNAPSSQKVDLSVSKVFWDK